MKWKFNIPGIPDHLFIRGDVPMTKSEVRALTLSKLELTGSEKILDIGGGTGSVTIECGIFGGKVTTIEKKSEGIDLIKRNLDRFQVDNVRVIHGKAPESIPDETFDRVFIGGSGGDPLIIIQKVYDLLEIDGVLVANTVTVDNSYRIKKSMMEVGFKDIELVQIQVSRSKQVGDIHMLMAENPITIIRGRKLG